MDKILISNSFKNLLQSLGAKDASNLSNISSKAVPVVDTASGSTGTLLGYSTMSTLASVLGGYGIATEINQNTDANTITTPGTYIWSSYQRVPQNVPNVAMAGSMIVSQPQANMVVQVIYFNGNSGTIPAVYQRIRWGNDWYAWQRCDNFGCNTLAELKAALAAV